MQSNQQSNFNNGGYGGKPPSNNWVQPVYEEITYIPGDTPYDNPANTPSDSDSDGDLIPKDELEELGGSPREVKEIYECGQCGAHRTHSLLDLYNHKKTCMESEFCVTCLTNLSIQPVTEKIIETVEELVKEADAKGKDEISVKSIREPKESKDWFKKVMEKYLIYEGLEGQSIIECTELLKGLRQRETYHRITATMIKQYLMRERNDVKHIKAKYNKSAYYKCIKWNAPQKIESIIPK